MLASLLLAVISMDMLDFGSFVAASLIFLFWYIGRRLRFRGEYLRLLEERAEHLERSKSIEAQRAVAQERTRIAREMHDIVAHQVSLMTVQAGAAKTVAASNPGAAIAAMGAVESAGRQALSEMRYLLDVLRPERPDAELAPQPGLSQLAQLASEVSAAGKPVRLVINGESERLPAGINLTLYRIVQESLTNVLKHAGNAASATVTIDILDTEVRLVVRDTGGGDRAVAHRGHGIAGMRERAELLDGSLEAGPSALGGFEVYVSLPLSLPSSLASSLHTPGGEM
jgi:signal transduction histidine kinase